MTSRVVVAVVAAAVAAVGLGVAASSDGYAAPTTGPTPDTLVLLHTVARGAATQRTVDEQALVAARSERHAAAARTAPLLAQRDPLAPVPAAEMAEWLAVLAAGPGADVGGGGGLDDGAVDAILGDYTEPRRLATEALAAADATVAGLAARVDASRVGAAAASEQYTAARADAERANSNAPFAIDLLERLALPVTVPNVRVIDAWAAAEAVGAHANNPLATTMPMPGAVAINDHGVKRFEDRASGVEATARTLMLYPGVLDALRRGDDALAVALAVAASPWGTGGAVYRRLVGAAG